MDEPCNGHGNCSQGITGTGLCQCFAGYSGRACEICDQKGTPDNMCSPTAEGIISMRSSKVACKPHDSCSLIRTVDKAKPKLFITGGQRNAILACLFISGDNKRNSCKNSRNKNPSNYIHNCYLDVSEDRCQRNNGGCHEDAECRPAGGHVTCRCRKGYTGDGLSCESACLHRNGGCHPAANCSLDEVKSPALC